MAVVAVVAVVAVRAWDEMRSEWHPSQSSPPQHGTARHSTAQGMALHRIVRWRSTRKAKMARHKDHVRIAGRLAHPPLLGPDPGTWVRGDGSRCVQSFAYPGGVG
ncbi:hypothetical protein CGLO_11196 [Colletotrichum gloeosporioides Cg-14]|uniref:Uncharacterized protein n=1 Tax=Colletotrichum gloeosporioides (strain Cg-14) TaxID=1237896 RepID=T0LMK5_COLGC|nr:hypothetical protein CGLO_11196 [Colletotrichum gloeosporioides Cg-14]